MGQLKLEQFLKLSRLEKEVKYKDLSEHDRFLYRTQYDHGGEKAINITSLSEEERKKSKEILQKHLRKIGVIKE